MKWRIIYGKQIKSRDNWCGRIGNVHALSIKNLIPEVEIKAVSDVRYEAAKEMSSKHGIPYAYEDYHEILQDPEIDAVLICSSTDTHAQIAIEAAEAKTHIL